MGPSMEIKLYIRGRWGVGWVGIGVGGGAEYGGDEGVGAGCEVAGVEMGVPCVGGEDGVVFCNRMRAAPGSD